MKITAKIALEVVHHEAIIRQAYKDSKNVWTWSAGLTNATGHNVERYIDNPQPMQKCLEILVWALEKYADEVREAFEGHALTEEQFAGALSFHWNTGAIKTATWVRQWKNGEIFRARKSFMNYRRPPEIIPRRQKERGLFFAGKWSSDGTTTEYTRLTRNHSPVWGSAVCVNIEDDINRLLGEKPRPDMAQLPEPTKPKRPWWKVWG